MLLMHTGNRSLFVSTRVRLSVAPMLYAKYVFKCQTRSSTSTQAMYQMGGVKGQIDHNYYKTGDPENRDLIQRYVRDQHVTIS